VNAQIVKVIAWGCKILFLGLALSLGGASAHAQYFAYITNSTDGTVSVIDTATNAVVATIPVGTAPQSHQHRRSTFPIWSIGRFAHVLLSVYR